MQPQRRGDAKEDAEKKKSEVGHSRPLNNRYACTRLGRGVAPRLGRPVPPPPGPGRRRHAEGPAPQAPASLALAVIDSRSGRSGRGLVSGLPSSEKLRLKLYATAVSAKSRALRSRPRYLAHE